MEVTKRLRGEVMQEFEEKEIVKNREREDVGGNIVIFGRVMWGGG